MLRGAGVPGPSPNFQVPPHSQTLCFCPIDFFWNLSSPKPREMCPPHTIPSIFLKIKKRNIPANEQTENKDNPKNSLGFISISIILVYTKQLTKIYVLTWNTDRR